MSKAPKLRVISSQTPEQIKAGKIKGIREQLNRNIDLALDHARNVTPETAYQLIFSLSQMIFGVVQILVEENEQTAAHE